jgi:hypothetical protein
MPALGVKARSTPDGLGKPAMGKIDWIGVRNWAGCAAAPFSGGATLLKADAEDVAGANVAEANRIDCSSLGTPIDSPFACGG